MFLCSEMLPLCDIIDLNGQSGSAFYLNREWDMKSKIPIIFAFALFFLSVHLVDHRVSFGEVIAQHQGIAAWEGTRTCLQCHDEQAQEVFGSVHYQWLGETPSMVDGPAVQGKLYIGVNSYCINITGNWAGCSSCHVGLGARPEETATQSQLENIDCLICHQESYRRVKVDGTFRPDSENMQISMLQAARTVHMPTRVTCLQCHAKGGGGDNYKRGDLALAHGTTEDRNFDVHMSRSGGNLTCQQCHVTQRHRMAGRGSDLRPTEFDIEMRCDSCHLENQAEPVHQSTVITRHLNRVACQVCHIPNYARNAVDTPAPETTETHRDWRNPHTAPSGAIHPTPVLEGTLTPKYRWWNGQSASYLLYDDAGIDPQTGRIPTSRPQGTVAGNRSMLYPFKYKTATQPLVNSYNQLIALDTSVYFSTGDVGAAVVSGLANMGYATTENYSWVETDTFQLITHEVAPRSETLSCQGCHAGTARMDLTGKLGYQLKGARSTVCLQCHGQKDGEDEPEYLWVHDEHVREENLDCSWCHLFSRPERNLTPSPLLERMYDLLTALKILVGSPAEPSATLEDINADGRIGMEEVIQLLKESVVN